jgi:hypothetical protein
MPLSAVLILFDFIIDNPMHESTPLNLKMLAQGADYFRRFEQACDGVLPGSLAQEFADLARDYVAKIKSLSSDDNDDTMQVDDVADKSEPHPLGVLQTLLGKRLSEGNKTLAKPDWVTFNKKTTAQALGFRATDEDQWPLWDPNMISITSFIPSQGQQFRGLTVPAEPQEPGKRYIHDGGLVFPEWENE